MTAWDLLVDREELSRTDLVDVPLPALADGDVLLRVSRVGLTANNVTYAVMGQSMHYWDFFPAEPGRGRVPVWGFADVVESTVDGLGVGDRVYGYLPTSSHLVVRPDGASGGRFRDTSAHRAALPAIYNAYHVTGADPAYADDTEPLQVLYRPLFGTSYFLDDHLADNAFFGADTVVFSSASSKTAYCTAHLTHDRADAPEVVGLTSAANVAFSSSLGCYDRVLSYDDAAALPTDKSAVYVDMAGSAALRSQLHRRLGEALLADVIVGFTHHDEPPVTGELPGVRPTFFFAPDQIKKRSEQWGPAAMQERFGAAWHRFVPVAADWVDVVEHLGPQALADVWRQLVGGDIDPRAGHVVSL